jgi:hypothetical protein
MALTGELGRIDDELRRAYAGDCWHGPPLREVLKELSATKARGLHPQLAHSAWALVNHLAAWVEVVALRVIEHRAIATPDAGDFNFDSNLESQFSPLAEQLQARASHLLHRINSRGNAIRSWVCGTPPRDDKCNGAYLGSLMGRPSGRTGWGGHAAGQESPQPDHPSPWTRGAVEVGAWPWSFVVRFDLLL